MQLEISAFKLFVVNFRNFKMFSQKMCFKLQALAASKLIMINNDMRLKPRIGLQTAKENQNKNEMCVFSLKSTIWLENMNSQIAIVVIRTAIFSSSMKYNEGGWRIPSKIQTKSAKESGLNDLSQLGS